MVRTAKVTPEQLAALLRQSATATPNPAALSAVGVTFNKEDDSKYYDKYAAASTTKPAAPSTPQPTVCPYKVRVRINNLRIRKGPGTNYASRGYTGPGIFTIVEEAEGQGATRWGLLKAYKSNRSGWISLDYTAKL